MSLSSEKTQLLAKIGLSKNDSVLDNHIGKELFMANDYKLFNLTGLIEIIVTKIKESKREQFRSLSVGGCCYCYDYCSNPLGNHSKLRYVVRNVFPNIDVVWCPSNYDNKNYFFFVCLFQDFSQPESSFNWRGGVKIAQRYDQKYSGIITGADQNGIDYFITCISSCQKLSYHQYSQSIFKTSESAHETSIKHQQTITSTTTLPSYEESLKHRQTINNDTMCENPPLYLEK
jgi:hypothetical protein